MVYTKRFLLGVLFFVLGVGPCVGVTPVGSEQKFAAMANVADCVFKVLCYEARSQALMAWIKGSAVILAIRKIDQDLTVASFYDNDIILSKLDQDPTMAGWREALDEWCEKIRRMIKECSGATKIITPAVVFRGRVIYPAREMDLTKPPRDLRPERIRRRCRVDDDDD